MNQSEVAQMRQQIEAEARAGWNALYGLRQGGAEHRVIEAQMDRYLGDLSAKIGDNEAYALVASFDEEATPQQGGAS